MSPLPSSSFRGFFCLSLGVFPMRWIRLAIVDPISTSTAAEALFKDQHIIVPNTDTANDHLRSERLESRTDSRLEQDNENKVQGNEKALLDIVTHGQGWTHDVIKRTRREARSIETVVKHRQKNAGQKRNGFAHICIRGKQKANTCKLLFEGQWMFQVHIMIWIERELSSLLVNKGCCFEVGREAALQNSESDTCYIPC